MANSNGNGRRVLSRADLVAVREAARARIEEFDVPEWGGVVKLRVMTGTERDAYEAEIVGTRGGKDRRLNLFNLRARLVARCLLGEDDAPLFDWRKPADIDELGAMDAAGLDRVFKRVQEMNGLTEKDIDDLTGNSKAEPSVVTGSN